MREREHVEKTLISRNGVNVTDNGDDVTISGIDLSGANDFWNSFFSQKCFKKKFVADVIDEVSLRNLLPLMHLVFK